MLLISLICTLSASVEGLEVSKAHLQSQSLSAKGADILTVSRVGEFSIDPLLCDSFSNSSAVKASGGLKYVEIVHARQSPNTPLQLAHLTPGLMRVIAPNHVTETVDNVLIGESAAKNFSLRRGDLVRTLEGDLSTFSGYINTGDRAPEMSRWIMVIDPILKPDQCWVEAMPGKRDAISKLLLFHFPTDHFEITSKSGSDSMSPVHELEERTTKHAWLLSAIICAFFSLSQMISRREEIGLRKILGFPKSSVVIQLQVEYGLICLASFWLSLNCSILVLTVSDSGSSEVIGFVSSSITQTLAFSSAINFVLALIFLRRDSFAMLRSS